MDKLPVARIDGAFVRGHDWSRTPLGPYEGWPRTLKGYVDMVVAMPTPAVIFWGPEQIQIYNDGYAVIMGPRHPRYFGAPYRECWPDSYPEISAWMQKVLERGEATHVTRAFFPLARYGFTEEAYFTFTFSPLYDDAGRIAGILQPVVEVTGVVLAERRAETLRALAPHAHSPNEAAVDAAHALALNPRDVPFSILYLADGPRLALAAHSGCGGAVPAGVPPIVLEACAANEPRKIEEVASLLGRAHHGVWGEETREAWVLPVRRSAADAPSGMIVLGVSPRLSFDTRYQEFFEAIVRELAANLAAASAKKAEEELLAREQAARREAELQKENLAALLTQAPAPMVLLRGPDLVIDLANTYACRLWRRSPEEVVGRPLLEALPELRGQDFDKLLARVYESGQTFVGNEYRARLGPPGDAPNEVYLNLVYAPLRNFAGEVDAVLAIGFDVTEQVRAREQVETLRRDAEAANQAKDEFLAMLGHELRNPLAPILTALQLMQLRGGSQLAQEREIIERQARHLLTLVDDLLDVSRITRGRIRLRKERVDLAESVASAIEIASPLLEQRNHELVVEALDRGLRVEADSARLAQVFSNLLTNAAKYTEPGGRVTVQLRRNGGEAEVSVRDTGVGIDPAMLPRVFELFAQSSRSLDRGQGGLGLGLAIVRSLVSLHGGSVQARSEGRGRGSEFVVRLPLVTDEQQSAGAQAPALASTPRRSNGGRILIVDDNEDAAQMLATALRLSGHTVHVAHDGAQALRAAREFRPQLALLDIGLPVMNGYELARELRALEELGALPLVAVTGYGQASDSAKARAAGFDAHLVKPVEIADLERVIARLLTDSP